MNRSRNSGSLEQFLQRFSLTHQHRVLGENAGAVLPLMNPLDPGIVQELVVPSTYRQTAFDFPIEALELCQHDRTLERIHSATHTHSSVDVPLTLAMHADFSANLRDRVIVGENRTTVAVAAKRLAWKKTGTPDSG
jgi:hypothetical protein